ncbi:MAG: tripartite tricarboxylate transporter substrate binding protein [Burkholderiaceae bacterium]|nr:tripartite tricarboxylate transporter substrate binding protein [Burkholderiaceae bacterium]
MQTFNSKAATRRQVVVAAALAAAGVALTAAPPARAQAPGQVFPARPLKILVPFAAGGPTDAIARVIAERMGADLSQSVLIDNRPGASTMLGAEAVARAPKDGYTLLLGTTSTFSTNPHLYKTISYTLADFAPIALMAKTDWVLTVNNDLPVRTIREFVDYGKAHPGALNYGMMGVGSSSHFVGKMIEGATSVRMVDVPYKGSGPALTDLMGGQVQVYVDAITTSLPLARAGKVRIIGIMGDRRAAIAPEIPTFVEAGFPDVVAQSWYGLFAPAGTPRAVVERLNASVQSALRSPEVTRRFASDGTLMEASTPESFAALVKRDSDKWGRLITPLGIKLD